MSIPRPLPIEEGSAPRVLGSPWLDHDKPAVPEPQIPEQAQAPDTTTNVGLRTPVEAPNMVALNCAEQGCPKSLPIWTQHRDNLLASDWRCIEHRTDAA